MTLQRINMDNELILHAYHPFLQMFPFRQSCTHGYVEVEIQIPFIQNGPICIPILVVPKSDLSDRVPVIFGTNILRICQEKLDCLDEEFKFQNSGILHFYPFIRILIPRSFRLLSFVVLSFTGLA
jgi:hypothetical protein